MLVLLTLAGLAGFVDGQASAAGARALRVGLVVERGKLADRGLNQLAYAGLVRAEHELGVKGRVLQSGSPAAAALNVAAFARQGYDLVIGVGAGHADAVAATAKRFPDVRFAIVDVNQRDLEGKPENVVGLLFEEQEAGYLAGYLGALSEKRRGGKAISAVAAKGARAGRYLAGYRAGARSAVPGIKVTWDYAGDSADRAECRQLALDQITQGSGVVFQVSGECGRGALDAAREQRAWGIGADADASALGPFVLTSALKGADVAVFATVEARQRGDLLGGRNRTFGLDGGGVRLGAVSRRAARADIEATRRVAKQIADGKIAHIPKTLGR